MNAKSNEELKTVYLFSGEVDPRRDSAVEKILIQALDPDYTDFDLERFDGNGASGESIISAAAMVPFGSPRKVVIVDRIERLIPDDQLRVAAFIPKLGRSCLILLAGESDSSQKKSSKSQEDESPKQKRKKGLQPELAKAVKEHGAVINFAKLKSDALSRLVLEAVTAHGKKIERAALEALANSIASSPSILDSEIEKLAAYTAERNTITLADVDQVVPKSAEDRVFPLIDAVAMRKADRAIQLLNETFSASAKPDTEVPRILALMGRHFRMLYQTKFLNSQGVRHLGSVPEKLQSMLMQEPKQSPVSGADWQQKRLLAQAGYFSMEQLERCLKHVLVCELAVKGLGADGGSPRLALEMLVLKLSQRN